MGQLYNFALTLSTEGRRTLRKREGLSGYYETSLPDMSPDQVEAAFDLAVRSSERAVQRQVRHHPLTQAQFDALVSYTYNLGTGGAMMVLRRIDVGDLDGAADAMLRQQLAPAGLAARRQEESAPFRHGA
ncbi:glycoside hydrolase family protein [Pseudoduganella sp. DS3]|uniref:Lysozyme n=1 Tax=Pseudoduganella guangdongensis TaxID=2692179 RepID=A0A6N9HB86_9BURK|nr:glycoside hydrolase family protein [Pseudoduganella guangdongensis]MYN00487.1 glycoside hydrolase family protein [Pseudoduganella guangdongensis]